MRKSSLVIGSLMVCAALGACSSEDSGDGSGGAAGTGGSAGSGGSSGNGGSAGQAGSAGQSGSAGQAGSAGSAGSAGQDGGSDGGGDGGTDANAACQQAAASFKPGTLVFYEFGNQISGTQLTILSNGTIEHDERSCCPPKTDPISEAALSGQALADLKADVQAVATGSWTTTEGPPPALGSESGVLCVVEAGQAFAVKVIEGTAGVATYTHQSSATGASEILSLVLGYASVDMP